MQPSIRGTRFPVGTWLVCRQCRAFYTHAKPCPCRQEGQERTHRSPRGRPRFLRVFSGLLEGLKGWWHGDV